MIRDLREVAATFFGVFGALTHRERPDFVGRPLPCGRQPGAPANRRLGRSSAEGPAAEEKSALALSFWMSSVGDDESLLSRSSCSLPAQSRRPSPGMASVPTVVPTSIFQVLDAWAALQPQPLSENLADIERLFEALDTASLFDALMLCCPFRDRKKLSYLGGIRCLAYELWQELVNSRASQREMAVKAFRANIKKEVLHEMPDLDSLSSRYSGHLYDEDRVLGTCGFDEEYPPTGHMEPIHIRAKV